MLDGTSLSYFRIFCKDKCMSYMKMSPVKVKGQLQRKYTLLSYGRALKMLKNDICITVIAQAVLEIFQFKLDIPRKCPRIRISLKVSLNNGEQ